MTMWLFTMFKTWLFWCPIRRRVLDSCRCSKRSRWRLLTQQLYDATHEKSKFQTYFLVADACFSGALFNNFNRGCTDNVGSYKSRWGFALGRLEYVFDGNSRESSTFNKYLTEYLEKILKRRVLRFWTGPIFQDKCC